MRDDTGTWQAGAVRVGAAFLLAGAGLAATTAVALLAVPGETVTAVVTAAPFLLAPPLAAAAGLTLTRGDARAAALGGGVGALGGGFVLGAFAIGTLVGVGGAVDVAGLVVPLLVAGVPTAAVGAGSGYLGARGDAEPDLTTETPTDSAPEPEPDRVGVTTTDSAPDPEPDRTDVTTTADGGSEPPAEPDGSDGAAVRAAEEPDGATAMSAPAGADPSPGEIDIDAWADDGDDEDDEDEEIEGLDDLFAKTPDPVANDGG